MKTVLIKRERERIFQYAGESDMHTWYLHHFLQFLLGRISKVAHFGVIFKIWTQLVKSAL